MKSNGAPVREQSTAAPPGVQTYNLATTTPKPLKVSVYRIPLKKQNVNALKVINAPNTNSFKPSAIEAQKSKYKPLNLRHKIRKPKHIDFKPSQRDPLYEIVQPTLGPTLGPTLSKVNNYLRPIRRPLYNTANLLQIFYRKAKVSLRKAKKVLKSI